MEQGSYSTEEVRFSAALGSGSIDFPHGFAVMTQTCDVVRDHGRVTVVMLTRLGPDDQAKWGRGKSPRYFQVVGDYFADFERVAVVSQAAAAEIAANDLSPVAARAFREAAARRFGRAPIPTHLDEVLTPLQKWLKSRAGKAAFAGMIERIREIRLAVSPDWEERTDKDTVELTLLFEPGDLAFPDEGSASVGTVAEIEAAIRHPPGEALVKLAGLLSDCMPGTPDDAAAWEAVAECFARMLEEKAAGVASGAPAVGRVVVTARTKADMTVAEYEQTERLDLSHLSTNDD